MNGKSLMMLGLAIGFGLCAMFLTRQMMGQDTGKQQEDVQDVLVAARDVKEEELLKPDAVKVIRMAKSAVPVGAFSAPKDVEDRWVKTALLEGDVVIEKKLGPKGTPPGLVANIPKGMRAFAIDVTEQSGVSGFILPGHRVDVIRFETDRGDPRGESILQDILVLAAGQVFTRAEERSLTTRTVTLALTPEQVDILVAARAKGSLALSLRGVNDHEVVARPAPKSVPNEAESRLLREEEMRKKLERELGELKATLAAREATPTVATSKSARHVTIYRGINRIERVRLDGNAAMETDENSTARLAAIDPFGIPLKPPASRSLAGGAGGGAGMGPRPFPQVQAPGPGQQTDNTNPPDS